MSLEEQCERFHQDLKDLETRYVFLGRHMRVDYCWMIHRDDTEKNIYAESDKTKFEFSARTDRANPSSEYEQAMGTCNKELYVVSNVTYKYCYALNDPNTGQTVGIKSYLGDDPEQMEVLKEQVRDPLLSFAIPKVHDVFYYHAIAALGDKLKNCAEEQNRLLEEGGHSLVSQRDSSFEEDGTQSLEISEHGNESHHDNENDNILHLNHSLCFLDVMFSCSMDVETEPISSYQVKGASCGADKRLKLR
ncbi:hypothetical protein PR048_027747 [Dryococelus australis]|uniref:Uncharacterized protein n=1 Tax=Dryococelus australis TaxID=614101 RepID=A0ABQ9GHE3_9NEOP|nr:hypothetical protein PR048_027747 [Dryococelus australis]